MNSTQLPDAHTPLSSSPTNPAPWVAASELQPHEGIHAQQPLDDLDEMLMESFPCSDPPCHGPCKSEKNTYGSEKK